jgi:DNA-directed RNA polymerase I subunit RPA43
VIPKTTTYKQFKEKKAREEAAAAVAPVAPGQTTLQNGFANRTTTDYIAEQPEDMVGEETDGVPSTPKLPLSINGSPIADRTLNYPIHSHPPRSVEEDIEMKDDNLH